VSIASIEFVAHCSTVGEPDHGRKFLFSRLCFRDRSELKEKLSTSSLMCKQMAEETEKNVTKRRKSFQGNKVRVVD